MAPERAAESVVRAVVMYDGQVLLVEQPDGDWRLPAGTPEPAETAPATAARVVHELTGYLVDGSATLGSAAAVGAQASAPVAVVCQLLTEAPSDGARLAPERIRWVAAAELVRSGRSGNTGLPDAVRDYLEGHTPV
ncbi:NUDIX domain-containing protein [Streptomyces sp. NPDC006393]|uniref:NUDIX domain-containing protein n=1 Tax=Streptomyces sp. NPDC006393 TaxID=3156763 RepID=UPI003405B0FA